MKVSNWICRLITRLKGVSGLWKKIGSDYRSMLELEHFFLWRDPTTPGEENKGWHIAEQKGTLGKEIRHWDLWDGKERRERKRRGRAQRHRETYRENLISRKSWGNYNTQEVVVIVCSVELPIKVCFWNKATSVIQKVHSKTKTKKSALQLYINNLNSN